MDIPEDVIDKKSYLKYLALSKRKIVNDGKLFDASDGTEINMAWLPHHLRRKIAHLPTEEQNEILELKSEYFYVNNNMLVLKRKAYGLKQGQKTSSLLEIKKDEIINLFGKMYSPNEIIKIMNEDWNLDFNSVPMLSKFRQKYKDEIEKKIEKFKSEYSDIRLGVKRGRLEELVWLYNSQKNKYQEKKGNESYKLLLQTLNSIRQEAEGERLTIDGKVDVKYETDLNKHLQQEIFKTLNIKEIILGRVAARMGVNPVKLIYSLNNSYYAKYSNVLGDYDPDVENEEMTYPSQMGYDFERIKKNQSYIEKNIEDAEIEDEEKYENDNDSEDLEETKNKILERLKKKKKKTKDDPKK